MSKGRASYLISHESSLFIIENLLIDCGVEYELESKLDQVQVFSHCTLGFSSPWPDNVIETNVDIETNDGIETNVDDDMSYLRQISNMQTITICSLSEHGGFYYAIKK